MDNNYRLQLAKKNVLYSYISSLITLIMKFVVRSFFIYYLGTNVLGINGLFSNILGLLSLSELGIGTAFNYSLYKPVSKNDKSKIIVLMALYKKVYLIIALLITILGLIIFPFLGFFMNGQTLTNQISIYYLLFLFNTVSSYFVSYRYGLANAYQVGYKIINIETLYNIFMSFVQIVVLYFFSSYLVFLLTQTFIQFVQKIHIYILTNKMYPFLNKKSDGKLSINERKRIASDVKGLMLHKLGDVSINQTDNIVISTFIGLHEVGIMSNYYLITTSLMTIISLVFNSLIGTLGNVFITEKRDIKLKFLDRYVYATFIIFAFSTLCFIGFVNPFVSFFWGGKNELSFFSVFLIGMNFYMTGQRMAINNLKSAAGIFTQDKYVSIIQGIINLLFSIILVKIIGINGVLIGTIISGIIPSLVKPIVFYKYAFSTSSKDYLVEQLIYFCFISLCSVGIYYLIQLIQLKNGILQLILQGGVAVVYSIIVVIMISFASKKNKKIIIDFLG